MEKTIMRKVLEDWGIEFIKFKETKGDLKKGHYAMFNGNLSKMLVKLSKIPDKEFKERYLK